jgi:hypothetical protein
MTSEEKKIRLVPWLLVLLPLWLIGSAGFALVKYFKDEKDSAVEEGNRFARSVTTGPIADDLRKLVSLIGERNTAKPEKLAATASMIRGLLGPSNIGYEVKSINGPVDFPMLQVTIPSLDADAAPVWILTSYDSPIGSRGAERNATGLTATLAAAQALAADKPVRPIHFLFLPHANEADAPIVKTAMLASKAIGGSPAPKAILCIEAMGDTETLILSSRDTEALPVAEFSGLGKILGAEVVCLGDDFDLASTLFEMDVPAIRVATRPMLLPDEKDDKLPFAPTVGASTGRLIELVRRLTKSP